MIYALTPFLMLALAAIGWRVGGWIGSRLSPLRPALEQPETTAEVTTPGYTLIEFVPWNGDTPCPYSGITT